MAPTPPAPLAPAPLASALPPPRGRPPHTVLPGFRLALASTLLALLLVVLLPLSTVVVRSSGLGGAAFWALVSSPRALASYRLTFGAAALAAGVNAVFGLLVAWVLVRYRFRGSGVVEALVDLPFALPTAVSGIALTTVWAPGGWLGGLLAPLGLQVAFAPAGVVLALVFVGLPFVVRTVQPVLEDLEADAEEAAAVLGAGRWQAFRRVVLPHVLPATLTGFALAFARGVGEYGSVVFISGNMPLRTEVTPLLIMTRLEQYDYAGATALATVMLAASLLLLLAINRLQAWSRRRGGEG